MKKIVLKDIPTWVPDLDVLQFLNKQNGIIVKSRVITVRFRDQNNKLTPFFTGDRFVFVKGEMAQALHHSALIDYAKCQVWHKRQELACRRCMHIGHISTNLKACDAYLEDQSIITIRSPNCVMSNYCMTNLKLQSIWPRIQIKWACLPMAIPEIHWNGWLGRIDSWGQNSCRCQSNRIKSSQGVPQRLA